jgi:hypothetical protein
MRNIHFQHNVIGGGNHLPAIVQLHRVRLFSPALCRVNRGSKIIVQGTSQMQATRSS